MLNEKTEIQRQGGSMSDTQNRNEPQEQERCIESSKSTNQIISISSNEMPSSKQDKLDNPNEGNVALVKKIVCNFIHKHNNITLLRGAFCVWKSVVDFAITKKMTHRKLIEQSCKRHNITLLRGAFCAWKMAVQVAPYKIMIVNVIDKCYERHNITFHRNAFFAWKMTVQVALAKKIVYKLIEKIHKIALLRGAFRLWNTFKKKLVSTFECGFQVIKNAVSVDFMCKILHGIHACPLNYVFRVWNMFKVDVLAKKRLISSMKCRIQRKRCLVAFRLWENFGKYMLAMQRLLNVRKDPKNLTLMRHFFGEWVLLPKKKMLEVRTFLEDIESEDYIDQIINRLTERGLFLANQESVESFDPENLISESDEASSDSDTEKLVSI